MKILFRMTMVVVLISTLITSCVKDEVNMPNQPVFSQANTEGDQKTHGGNTITGIISQGHPGLSIVLESEQYAVSSEIWTMNPESAAYIEYDHGSFTTVLIPVQSSNNKVSVFYAAKLNNNELVDQYLLQFEGTAHYNQSIGLHPIFYEMERFPFEGSLAVRNISGNGQLLPIAGVGVIEIEDLARRIWTPHGGHASWSDCFKHNAGEVWAIIGWVFAPVATLGGISLGCL